MHATLPDAVLAAGDEPKPVAERSHRFDLRNACVAGPPDSLAAPATAAAAATAAADDVDDDKEEEAAPFAFFELLPTTLADGPASVRPRF